MRFKQLQLQKQSKCCAGPLTWLWEPPSTPHAPWGTLLRAQWPQSAICGLISLRFVRKRRCSCWMHPSHNLDCLEKRLALWWRNLAPLRLSRLLLSSSCLGGRGTTPPPPPPCLESNPYPERSLLTGAAPKLRILPRPRSGEPVAGLFPANDHADGLTWSGPADLPLRLLRVVPDPRVGMRRASSLLRGETRPQKRICPPQTRFPHSDLSHPPLEVWCAERVQHHSSAVWQLGDALGLPPLPSVLLPPVDHVLGDTIGSLLQRTDPVPPIFQPSASLSIIPNNNARGFPSLWRASLLPGLLVTPRQVCLPQHGTLLPLSHFVHEWERLPGVSRWVLRTVRSGYTLQFGRNPPCLYKGKFKMLAMKTIMSQIQGGDWFVTIDLKDAYCHIQVIQRHRKFLRFAFGGKAYQYKVLPFGLALAPRTFTKCMDAALAPLRFQGIHVLNYLDDWLILAHSRELVSRHRDIVLRHIHSLGLRMNAKKSVLFPSQRTVFLGVHLDSVQMQARLAPARISNFTACLARFKLGHHVSVSTCRRLLGLMAAASPVLPLGLLHMRPFLWWMKGLRLHPTIPATRLIRVSHSCFWPLLQWRDPAFLQSGVRIGAIHRRHMITTDASMTGWGAVFESRPARGEWTGEFLSWHINCLELRAVFLTLMHFLPVLGKH